MGQGKDHMEIRGIDDFRPTFVHPDFLVYSLTDGAVPIPAGIIMGFRMSAFCADADVAAALFRFAADNVIGSFSLKVRQVRGFSTEGMIGITKNILYCEIRHEKHLPAGQKDSQRY